MTDGQLRIIGQNGSRTHDDRAHPRPQCVGVHVGIRAGQLHPTPFGARDPSIKAYGTFRRDVGVAALDRDSPFPIDLPRLLLEDSGDHIHSCLPQDIGTASGRRCRIALREDDTNYPGVNQRSGARGCASCVPTWLEGDNRGTSAGPGSRVTERHDFGVVGSRAAVPSTTHDVTDGVHDDASHARVLSPRGTGVLS
jgi:hypothetical protein